MLDLLWLFFEYLTANPIPNTPNPTPPSQPYQEMGLYSMLLGLVLTSWLDVSRVWIVSPDAGVVMLRFTGWLEVSRATFNALVAANVPLL